MGRSVIRVKLYFTAATFLLAMSSPSASQPLVPVPAVEKAVSAAAAVASATTANEPEPSDLPLLRVNVATHFDAGLEIGREFGARIHAFLRVSSALNTVLLPFVATDAGRNVYDEYVAVNQKTFPQYYEELSGMAQGADVPLEHLLLLSFSNELSGLAKNATGVQSPWDDSCTDVYVVSANGHRAHAHNEDADPAVKLYGYMVDVAIAGEVRFLSYAYPGYLPGNAFNTLEPGIAVTTNAVYPTHIGRATQARNWITRDVLCAVSMDDAIRRATTYRVGSGFSLNLASVLHNVIHNLEAAYSGSSLLNITDGANSHENLYRHLPNVEQYPSTSSSHRLARIQQMNVPESIGDILTILGDHTDTQWPIYRTNQAPDSGVMTVATGAWNIDANTFCVYTSNPGTTSQPLLCWKMQGLAPIHDALTQS